MGHRGCLRIWLHWRRQKRRIDFEEHQGCLRAFCCCLTEGEGRGVSGLIVCVLVLLIAGVQGGRCGASGVVSRVILLLAVG